jgi:hypothetical protein
MFPIYIIVNKMVMNKIRIPTQILEAFSLNLTSGKLAHYLSREAGSLFIDRIEPLC